MIRQLLGGVVGILLGVLLLGGCKTIHQQNYELAEASFAEIQLIRIEQQRIANALDRLVSIQSGATCKDVEQRNQ